MRPLWLLLGTLAACGPAAGPAQNVTVGHIAPRPEASPRVLGRKEVAALPIAEGLPIYRSWVADDDPGYASEAIAQLTWARDAAAVPVIARALVRPPLRTIAARALAELGDPAAKPALREALAGAAGPDRTAIVWALVVLGDASVAEDAVADYRSGPLEKERRLDGQPAFELERLVAVVSNEKATALASSDDPRERLLGLATLASRADTSSPPAVVSALGQADRESWARIVDAIDRGAGGRGLVLIAQATTPKTPAERATAQFRLRSIFARLEARADPRAGDALVRYLETKPDPHWRTEAAFRLAEIGDVRAAPTLAWRLAQDPLKLYGHDEELYRRDDHERVVAARLLADLATLHPAHRAELRKLAVPAVRAWLASTPAPHASGVRFLAAVEAKEVLPQLRTWANPREPLPRPGQQELPVVWTSSTAALRSLGAMRDASSWTILESQLDRRPAGFDASMDALLKGGGAVLGMTVRAVATGAAQGFSEWGDARAAPLLVKFIDEPLNNEQAKTEACIALGWVATDTQMREVLQKIRARGAGSPGESALRACYLETMLAHPSKMLAMDLVALIAADVDYEVRRDAARALGGLPLTPAEITELRVKLRDPAIRTDAAVALLRGGDRDAARAAMEAFSDLDPAAREGLKLAYAQLGASDFSDARYDDGSIARWAANAEAASHVASGDERSPWVLVQLARALQAVGHDSGPHTLTRVVLRARLVRDANTFVSRLLDDPRAKDPNATESRR